MLPDVFAATDVKAPNQAFESNTQTKIGDKVVDISLGKSLGLEEIPIEDLFELHYFNKDEDAPFEW